MPASCEEEGRERVSFSFRLVAVFRVFRGIFVFCRFETKEHEWSNGLVERLVNRKILPSGGERVGTKAYMPAGIFGLGMRDRTTGFGTETIA